MLEICDMGNLHSSDRQRVLPFQPLGHRDLQLSVPMVIVITRAQCCKTLRQLNHTFYHLATNIGTESCSQRDILMQHS